MSDYDHLNETIQRLNTVSPSFCLAKWKQVTVHLQSGQTHSCHHPGTHAIPVAALKDNPSVLHNTDFKKQQRKMMLEGKRPAECDYCWNIEDLGSDVVSDRHIKSNDHWARPDLDTIKNLPWDADVNPSYVEVSFSHLCNFKCIYCLPHISSAWESEIKKTGPYVLHNMHFNSTAQWDEKQWRPLDEASNPYIDAFWKWIPQLKQDLKILRVTGGEPLLSQHTFRLLDYLYENPHPQLELNINTNLGVSDERIQRFIEACRKLSGKVKSIGIYTSIDTWGEQAEYIRSGLRLKSFEKNLETLLREVPYLYVTWMCTFNFLSVFNFNEMLSKAIEYKRLAAEQNSTLVVDISYLRFPEFLSFLLHGPRVLSWLTESLKFMKAGPFTNYENGKMHRLVEYALQLKVPFDLHGHRKNLMMYLAEIDRRRGCHYPQVFPELPAIFAQWDEQSVQPAPAPAHI